MSALEAIILSNYMHEIYRCIIYKYHSRTKIIPKNPQDSLIVFGFLFLQLSLPLSNMHFIFGHYISALYIHALQSNSFTLIQHHSFLLSAFLF